MPHPVRLLAAALVLAAGFATTGCDSGTYVDGTPGQAQSRAALGWSRVDPVAIDLPTAEPVIDGATAADGKPVLVNIWASWCPPCKKELPLLQEVAAGGRLHVIGFSRERSKDNALEALRTAGVTYPNWLDGDAKMALELDGRVPFNSVPSSVLIRDGQVVAVHIGEFKSRDDILKALELR
ncbi:MAG: TlpA disulfide reductase family protein [Propionibacteriales bacterium]|nr:TlpA disulfide reductase family protein [Propionibacteriales bacterium]